MNDLQHIVGAWECVDAWPPYFKRFVGCFFANATIGDMDRGSEMFDEIVWPDTLAYAERERELQPPAYGESFLPEMMKTFAMLEEYQQHWMRMAGVPKKYLEDEREPEQP